MLFESFKFKISNKRRFVRWMAVLPCRSVKVVEEKRVGSKIQASKINF